ncbi:hypothetical protein SAY86_006696 [Trapa natans]|uniref:Uncharacterized protein n=1 Tax=Trapa natans TaxID=22666 RepID=A0AAN7LA93_TRANT|nr:hypothetical protein SAY86_006696 [Trapa natans]
MNVTPSTPDNRGWGEHCMFGVPASSCSYFASDLSPPDGWLEGYVQSIVGWHLRYRPLTEWKSGNQLSKRCSLPLSAPGSLRSPPMQSPEHPSASVASLWQGTAVSSWWNPAAPSPDKLETRGYVTHRGSREIDEPIDITSKEFAVRITCQECGGGAFSCSGDVIVFLNYKDQRLYKQPISSRDSSPVPITPDYAGSLVCYADGVFYFRFSRYITIREVFTEVKDILMPKLWLRIWRGYRGAGQLLRLMIVAVVLSFWWKVRKHMEISFISQGVMQAVTLASLAFRDVFKAEASMYGGSKAPMTESTFILIGLFELNEIELTISLIGSLSCYVYLIAIVYLN